MLQQLLPIFYNNTRSLEVLYLLEGQKQALRLDASLHELEKIESFCFQTGIFLEASDFKLIKIRDVGKGAFSNRVEKVSLADGRPGLFHLYLSKNKQIARDLKEAEAADDDQKAGKILGYPQCCIDFFIRNKKEQQGQQNDYILPALANSPGIAFPFFCNHAIRYFDVTLLSHFPHAFNCSESAQIASERLRIMQKHAPGLVEKFESLLKSAVLYTEREGVFIFRNHSLEAEVFSYQNVLCTADSALLKRLLKIKELRIIDNQTILLENEKIKEAGFMIFS